MPSGSFSKKARNIDSSINRKNCANVRWFKTTDAPNFVTRIGKISSSKEDTLSRKYTQPGMSGVGCAYTRNRMLIIYRKTRIQNPCLRY